MSAICWDTVDLLRPRCFASCESVIRRGELKNPEASASLKTTCCEEVSPSADPGNRPLAHGLNAAGPHISPEIFDKLANLLRGGQRLEPHPPIHNDDRVPGQDPVALEDMPYQRRLDGDAVDGAARSFGMDLDSGNETQKLGH